MKTMKHLIWILIALLCNRVSIGQELYGEQSWELKTDINNNGWVDDGDVITNTIKVTYNHIIGETIIVENGISDPHLTLISGSVRASKGIISSGNTQSDEHITIDELYLDPTWDGATITFDAVANFDAAQITHIFTKSRLISPIQTVETNEVSIPVKSSFIASNDKAGLFSNAIVLLSILALGILSGVVSNRLKVKRPINQPSLEQD